jgi:GNAT superfamily N-acetyltransferase
MPEPLVAPPNFAIGHVPLSDVIIRRIEEGDGELYQALQLTACDDAPHAFGPVRARIVNRDTNASAQLASRLSSAEHETVLLALANGQPVGTASLLLEGSRAWLSFVWIDPKWRRTGLAQRLLGVLSNFASAQGPQMVYGRVLDENPRALAFYLRNGWSIAGTESWPSNPLRTRTIITKILCAESAE